MKRENTERLPHEMRKRIGKGQYVYTSLCPYRMDYNEQFILKVENRGEYPVINEEGSYFNHDFDMYITGDRIRGEYSYIEYIGDDSFENQYKRALKSKIEILFKTGYDIEFFIFNNYVFLLKEKYLIKSNRGTFKEMDIHKKDIIDIKVKSKKGSERSSRMQQAILVRLGG